jgi:hypothetical protein
MSGHSPLFLFYDADRMRLKKNSKRLRIMAAVKRW